jgi:predicted peptidase
MEGDHQVHEAPSEGETVALSVASAAPAGAVLCFPTREANEFIMCDGGTMLRGRSGASPVLWLLLAACGIVSASRATASDRAPQQGRFEFRSVRLADHEYPYAVWLPPAFESRDTWPGILFLHGSGESGNDGVKPTKVGIGTALVSHPERWPCVVVFPQKPSENEEWEEREDMVFAVLDSARSAFHITAGQVALTGLSQGGHGTWMFGARHPDRWTCLAPVSAYGRARTVSPRVARLPVWAFHGLKDDVVDPKETRLVLEWIHDERKRLGLDPDGARVTFYPDANHNSWDSAYAEPELPGWLLGKGRAQ